MALNLSLIAFNASTTSCHFLLCSNSIVSFPTALDNAAIASSYDIPLSGVNSGSALDDGAMDFLPADAVAGLVDAVVDVDDDAAVNDGFGLPNPLGRVGAAAAVLFDADDVVS